MAAKFVIHYRKEKGSNSFEGEREITAETQDEAENEFWKEQPHVDNHHWSCTVTYIEKK